jgi:hypothetical protein
MVHASLFKGMGPTSKAVGMKGGLWHCHWNWTTISALLAPEHDSFDDRFWHIELSQHLSMGYSGSGVDRFLMKLPHQQLGNWMLRWKDDGVPLLPTQKFRVR